MQRFQNAPQTHKRTTKNAIATVYFQFILLYIGFESSAKQYCPPSLLARMDYNYTGSDSSVACSGSNDDWDVCTDRMVMTFNYSTCAQQMANSGTENLCYSDRILPLRCICCYK